MPAVRTQHLLLQPGLLQGQLRDPQGGAQGRGGGQVRSSDAVCTRTRVATDFCRRLVCQAV